MFCSQKVAGRLRCRPVAPSAAYAEPGEAGFVFAVLYEMLVRTAAGLWRYVIRYSRMRARIRVYIRSKQGEKSGAAACSVGRLYIPLVICGYGCANFVKKWQLLACILGVCVPSCLPLHL